MPSQRAVKAACIQVLREGLDRILVLLGAVAAMISQSSNVRFVCGTAIVVIAVVVYLVISFRRALELTRLKHLPVIIAIGCSDEEYRGLVRDAINVLHDDGFDSESFERRFALVREDFTMHIERRLSADRDEWQSLVRRVQGMVATLHSRIPGREVFHFFLRGPGCFAIGLGAALGTKNECIFHHYQPGAGQNSYHPVLKLTAESGTDEGLHILKTRLALNDLKHVQVTGLDGAGPKVYVGLGLAGHQPAPVRELAQRDDASFVEIRSVYSGTIPLTADWLRIVREINSVLLELLGNSSVRELHLFPALPLPIAFGVGMGIDTRSKVHVNQWNFERSEYDEVLRLNELAAREHT
jgi:hypothetical protein